MKVEAKTPAEYISKLEEPRRSEIKKLHKLILKTAPKLKPALAKAASALKN